VVKNVGIKSAEPNRLTVGYEVNLMSFIGKRNTQFGSHYAASTKSWVTNDSYSHILFDVFDWGNLSHPVPK
jgi:hypothetical protein